MSRYVFRMPDLGEGTVEAELVAWHVKPGDLVREDQVMAEVMTEKASVEVPAPVSGRVVSVSAGPGDRVPVGAELIVFETEAATGAAPAAGEPQDAADRQRAGNGSAPTAAAAAQRGGESAGRVMASPATRRRAQEAGIDLHALKGTGPGGRITRGDLLQAIGAAPRAAPAAPAPAPQAPTRPADARAAAEEIKVIGLRRQIAQRMSEAKRDIPHFAYVEEVDVTELEALRRHLNERQGPEATPYTYLPFIVAALVRVLERFPQCNATYDAERGVLLRHRAVHVGIATQTADGLTVPVVRNAESLSLAQLAEAIRRVSDAARAKKASREELAGSTITVTSLGKLGGIVSTPVINAPEVAIIGINKAIERPVVHHGAVAVRRIMNLSSSFDHRFVDGFDAAAMIQALKDRLEHPATIFIQD